MTEFRSRRELREAERQGLVAAPEQVFDLPTGSIKTVNPSDAQDSNQSQDVAAAAEMLTRRRLREMERNGSLDPLTGSVPIQAGESMAEPIQQSATPKGFDEILAESEEPVTSSVNIVPEPKIARTLDEAIDPKQVSSSVIAATDIFHEMAVDLNTRRPRRLIWSLAIVLVLAAAAAGAYMLGIFK